MPKSGEKKRPASAAIRMGATGITGTTNLIDVAWRTRAMQSNPVLRSVSTISAGRPGGDGSRLTS
jgi:hypothetical protein